VRETQADILRRRLADQIITGQRRPGNRLDEREIAGSSGLSRTPVREALRQLAAIGLAERRPHRGVIVARPSDDYLAETFELMADVESLCARYAATRMSAAERRALESHHLASGEFVRLGDRERYAAHNTEFHEFVYRGSHNRALEETAHAVRRRLAPYRRGQFAMLGRLVLSFAEHDRVVGAIVRGEATAAAEAMRSHVSTVGVASADYVAGRTSTSDSEAAS
jgi:DNA-binding GntR family transcriptional regulator